MLSRNVINQLVTYFKDPSNSTVLDSLLTNKDPALAQMLLKGFGYRGQLSNDDFESTLLLAAARKASGGDPNKMYSDIRSVLIGTPKEYLIRGIGAALSAGLHIFGDMSLNKYQSMAEALLARNRNQTPEQQAIYGYNKKDQQLESDAIDLVKKGKDRSIVANEIAGAVDKLLGTVNQREDAARMMAASSQLGAPGALYNYMNGLESRQQKANKR